MDPKEFQKAYGKLGAKVGINSRGRSGCLLFDIGVIKTILAVSFPKLIY